MKEHPGVPGADPSLFEVRDSGYRTWRDLWDLVWRPDRNDYWTSGTHGRRRGTDRSSDSRSIVAPPKQDSDTPSQGPEGVDDTFPRASCVAWSGTEAEVCRGGPAVQVQVQRANYSCGQHTLIPGWDWWSRMDYRRRRWDKGLFQCETPHDLPDPGVVYLNAPPPVSNRPSLWMDSLLRN